MSLQLGKQPPQHDSRTLRLARYLATLRQDLDQITGRPPTPGDQL